MMDAIIFDFDGLVLETEQPLYETWRGVYIEHGHDLPVQDWIAQMGRPAYTENTVAKLNRLVGGSLDTDAVVADYKRRLDEVIARQPVLPGVVEVLRDAEALGLGLAVASGSSRRWVVGHLDRLSLTKRFSHVTTNEDTTAHKPDPAPFLHAAAALDVKPARTMVLEDSENGIASAKAAGMFAVAIPSVLTRPMPFDHADLRLDSLDQMPLAEVIQKLDAGRAQP